MRRPALVKPFFGRAISKADRRPTGGAQCCHPKFQITDSPYFHPHSLWSLCSGASWVSSMGNGCCRLGRELKVAVSSKSFLARVAVTRTRRFAPYPTAHGREVPDKYHYRNLSGGWSLLQHLTHYADRISDACGLTP